MIELRHIDVRQFLIEECTHIANGCITKCGCIGLIIFRNLSCLGAITGTYYRICFGIMNAESVTLWLQVVQPFTRHPWNKMDVPH